VNCGRGPVAQQRVRLVSSPPLAALRRTGTAHVYADTADSEELQRVLAVAGGGILGEVDGNTVRRGAPRTALPPYVYTMVSGWIGNDRASRKKPSRP
jgi:hypothetical protein